MTQLIDLFLHLDVHLQSVIQQYGTWTYAILFTIIFCETGLVVTPILPGDSLLFAAGAFAATGSLNPYLLSLLLGVAALSGDVTNYSIGRYMGPKVLTGGNRFLKKEYLDRTHKFFEKYGGKTIIFARFVPIVRTFSPFLAGVGRMTYTKFISFSVVGAAVWIGIFIGGGVFFGNIPAVKHNFTLVILAILVISVMPAVIEALKHRRSAPNVGV